MKSRAAELRERERRVFRWALAAAVLVHVAAFVYWPVLRPTALQAPELRVRPVSPTDGMPIYVEILFGPPEIRLSDGSLERQERTLEAARVLRLPPECAALVRGRERPPEGRVHLRVNAEGRAAMAGMIQSTGDACGDEVVSTVADALWYRWLPSDRFPAPVNLVQPVTLVEAESQG